jgi:hypothetical protein
MAIQSWTTSLLVCVNDTTPARACRGDFAGSRAAFHYGVRVAEPVRPVLVTGAIRSGTTWVGTVLGRSPALEYVWEPFNPLVRAWPHNRVPHFFTGPYDAQPAIQQIADALMQLRSRGHLYGPHPETIAREVRRRWRFAQARHAHRTPLLKDPLAVLLARYLQDRHDMTVVLCIRHPAGFVSSVMRLGWDYDFENLLAQPKLMRRLEPWREEMQARINRTGPMLERVTLLWRVIHGALATTDLAPRDPYVVRHEAASAAPVETYRALFARVGVELTPDIAAAAKGEADSSRTATWRANLSDDDIAYVKETTAPEAAYWGYGADAWP